MKILVNYLIESRFVFHILDVFLIENVCFYEFEYIYHHKSNYIFCLYKFILSLLFS